MKIGVLGTGMVGRAHAARLSGLGHDVVIGTQDVGKTLASAKADAMGNEPFSEWHKKHGKVRVLDFTGAAAHGEVVINALKGEAAVSVLKSVGKSLEGKLLIDISNPLDFSKGMPPSLLVSNTDSLGEQIQRALPQARVVKTLNTLNAHLQVDPKQLAGGDHTIFVSGNDEAAKAQAIKLLKGYGWEDIIDLGDITTARGTEMILPLWVRLWGRLQNPLFNVKIVQGKK